MAKKLKQSQQKQKCIHNKIYNNIKLTQEELSQAVMWWLSRSKSQFFKRKLNGIDIAISGASVTQFRYRIALERPVISAGGHRMGFTTHAYSITPSIEEFISPTRNTGVRNSKLNRHWVLYKKSSQNRIKREKATIVTSLKPRLVGSYDLRPGNRTGLFWQK